MASRRPEFGFRASLAAAAVDGAAGVVAPKFRRRSAPRETDRYSWGPKASWRPRREVRVYGSSPPPGGPITSFPLRYFHAALITSRIGSGPAKAERREFRTSPLPPSTSNGCRSARLPCAFPESCSGTGRRCDLPTMKRPTGCWHRFFGRVGKPRSDEMIRACRKGFLLLATGLLLSAQPPQRAPNPGNALKSPEVTADR